MRNYLLSIFFISLAFIGISNNAFSQSCSGTVSNGQNLVTNGDFSQGYTGWTHDPAYIEFTPCNGCYSVPGRIYAGTDPHVFNPGGFVSMDDHSPSGDNSFLMVDGICQLGINLFSQTNISIEPNTDYFFTVWIASLKTTGLSNGENGKLNFNINGVDLPNQINAPATAGVWVKYTAVWYSGLNPPPTLSVSIQNLTTTGCNDKVDFAIDDISFSPGCEFGSPGPQPDLGSDFSICGKTLPFNINPNFVPDTASRADITYNWYKDGVLQNSASGLGPAFYNYSVTGPGTYTVCAAAGGSCPKSDIIEISNTFSIELGPDLTLCNPITATLDAGYSGPGVTYQWYKDGNSITGAQAQTLTVSSPGTYSVDVTDPSCGLRNDFINISTDAAIPNDSTFCPTVNNGVTHLSVTGTGKYKWWSAATGGTALGTGNAYTTLPLTAPGPYTYFVEDTSTFALNIGPAATGNGFSNPTGIGANDSKSRLIFNALNSFRLDSITVLPYNYYCPNPASGNHNVVNIIIKDANGVTVGTSSYDAQCNGTGQPAAPLKVPVGINIPQGNGYTMMLNTGSTQIALYLNPGTFTYPTSYSSVVEYASNSSSDFNPFYSPNAFPGFFNWKITKGINCLRVPVTATMKCVCTAATPVTKVDVDSANYCVGAIADITLSVTGGSGDNLVWYSGSCGGTMVGTNTTGADITIAAPTVPTTYYARWESALCNSSCVSVSVNPVAPPTVAVAGSNQNICNLTTVTLNGNSPAVGGGSGLWSVVSGTGATILTPDNPSSQVNILDPGDHVFQWTINNSPCPASSSQVTVHRDTLTDPVISGSTFSPCVSASGLSYTTSVNYTGTKYTWSTLAGGSLVITSASNVNPVTIDIGASGGTLIVKDSSGVCVLTDSTEISPVQPPVKSAAGMDQKICNVTSTTLAANAASPAGSIGTWSIISGTGVIANINDPLSTVSGLLSGADLKLRWTISNSCADSISDVTIHRDTLTDPVISGSTFRPCASASGLPYTTSVIYTGTKYTWSTLAGGSLVITSANNVNPVTIDIGASGGTLIVKDSSGACVLTDSTEISPVQPPVKSVAGADQNICNATSVMLAGNTPSPAGSTGTWSILSGTGVIADVNDPLSAVSGLSLGDIKLRWTISNSCGDSISDVTIHRDSLKAPVLSLTGASYDTCALTTGVSYATTVDRSSTNTYTWSTSGIPNTLVITSTPNNAAVVDVGASGGTLIVTEVSGACSLSDSMPITISPNIVQPTVGPDQLICMDHSFLSASVGNGKWTVSSGSGIFADDTDPDTEVTGLTTNLINTFTWTVSGCGGPLSADLAIDVRTSNLALSPVNGPSDTLCVGTARVLNATAFNGSGQYLYLWLSSDSSFRYSGENNSVSVTPQSDSTRYTVIAVDKINLGCVSQAQDFVIHALSRQNLSINNLLTPNSDHLNDELIIRDQVTLQKLLPGAKLEVFNQWGSKVFKSDSYDNTWGAKELSDGIYYYHLKTGCGSDVYKGWLQILR